MALYKDGEVIRTFEQQLDHLTEAHKNQLEFNSSLNSQISETNSSNNQKFENLQQELNKVSIAANLGGYNLVRFSFQKSGTYYKLSNSNISIEGQEELTGSAENDYFEITSGNTHDIPAYGYLDNSNNITIKYAGDFMAQYPTLTVKNVTKNKSKEISFASQYTSFGGSSLQDYDANTHKKQVFIVLDDITYGGSETQYVSFDLNNDDVYNYVYIGPVSNGKDGKSVYATDGTGWTRLKEKLIPGDSVIVYARNVLQDELGENTIGDVFQYQDNFTFKKLDNVMGPKGDKGDRGEKGDTGETGPTGQTGERGPEGQRGPKGDKGEPGDQGILIFTGILDNPSQLPSFESTKVGDAYRVINNSGLITTYDLYFHAKNGSTWDIQPNWGGVKGDKGDTGETGPAGPTGPTGKTGETGPQGPPGPAGENGQNGKDGIQGPAGENAKIGTITTVYNYDFQDVGVPEFAETTTSVVDNNVTNIKTIVHKNKPIAIFYASLSCQCKINDATGSILVHFILFADRLTSEQMLISSVYWDTVANGVHYKTNSLSKSATNIEFLLDLLSFEKGDGREICNFPAVSNLINNENAYYIRFTGKREIFLFTQSYKRIPFSSNINNNNTIMIDQIDLYLIN